jgi:hypothetical protein
VLQRAVREACRKAGLTQHAGCHTLTLLRLTLYEIPDEYKPVLDTTPEADISTSGYRYYDVSVADLIGADLLSAGQKLVMSYKPRHSGRKLYEGTLSPEGELVVMGKSFSAMLLFDIASPWL